jgi:hypothetical protein
MVVFKVGRRIRRTSQAPYLRGVFIPLECMASQISSWGDDQGGTTQVLEHLPSKHEAPSSNPHIAKKIMTKAKLQM